MNDPFHLERFLTAQNPELDQILEELRTGKKTGHWIWFIFPQLKGLGSSWAANHYGISSLAEAKAYLDHPILGPRLIECTESVTALTARPIQSIFGGIDSLKFRSSMTLFAEAGLRREVFTMALDKYFEGQPDSLTLDRLAQRQRTAEA